VILAQVDRAVIKWSWISDNQGEIAAALAEHLQLTVLAVTIGFLISMPLGLLAYRQRWLYGPVTFVTGVLYTIPSLALFALLLPYTRLTVTTAEIGLVSYTLLIFIRNIVGGLRGVQPEVREAAIGMGYSRRQLLWRVEIPLAIPVIMTGVRLATVSTIGLVTVASVIGRGGLGAFILSGLRTDFITAVLVGSVLSLLLAIAANAILVLLERRIAPWADRRIRVSPA
jgi:osmoprotectant transport system permease protein